MPANTPPAMLRVIGSELPGSCGGLGLKDGRADGDGDDPGDGVTDGVGVGEGEGDGDGVGRVVHWPLDDRSADEHV